jgi:hypothetical protein
VSTPANASAMPPIYRSEGRIPRAAAISTLSIMAG